MFMTELATTLLTRHGQPFTQYDVNTLAKDLETVEFDPALDSPFITQTTENIFLRRIGGIEALGTYMQCLTLQKRAPKWKS